MPGQTKKKKKPKKDVNENAKKKRRRASDSKDLKVQFECESNQHCQLQQTNKVKTTIDRTVESIKDSLIDLGVDGNSA